MSSHTASPSSKTNAGSHMNVVIGGRASPTSWSGRITTRRTEAKTPSQAIATGIIRPRSRSQEKSVLPTAKRIAAGLHASILRRNAASVCAAAVSGALAPLVVASHSKPRVPATKTPVIPSATRHIIPSIARSGSSSRVIAKRVTASTSAEKPASRVRITVIRMYVAC